MKGGATEEAREYRVLFLHLLARPKAEHVPCRDPLILLAYDSATLTIPFPGTSEVMGYPGCPHPLRHTAVRYPGLIEPVCLPLTCSPAPEPMRDKPLGKPSSLGPLSYRVASPGGHRRPGPCRAGLLGSTYLTPLGDCALSSCTVITYTINPHRPRNSWWQVPPSPKFLWIPGSLGALGGFHGQKLSLSNVSMLSVLWGPSPIAKIFPFSLPLGQRPELRSEVPWPSAWSVGIDLSPVLTE